MTSPSSSSLDHVLSRDLQNAFHGAATGIALTDMQGRFIMANKAFCDMLHYTEAELLEIDFRAITHPLDRYKSSQEIAALLAGERSGVILDKRYVSKQGHTVWTRVSISARLDVNQQIVGMIGIAEDLSEFREAEALRAETEQSMLNFLANLPGMVYRCRNDANWTMMYVSQSVLALTGYSAEDLLFNHRASYASLIHSEDIELVERHISEAIRRREMFNFEYRIRRADGQVTWVWEQGRAVFDEDGEVAFLEGYITDISMRKNAQFALDRSQRQSETLLNAVTEGILGVDRQGLIMFINQSALNMLGFEADELMGKSAHQSVHHHDKHGAVYPEKACPVFKTLQDGRIRHITDDILFRRDGSTFPAEFSVSPLYDEAAQISGAVISFTDMTQRLAMEEQIRQAQRLDSLGQLTGGVAHDFNNLLTVIMGNAELLEEHLPTGSAEQKLAGLVIAAAQRGADLTQALLAFARKQPLEPQVIDINALLEKNRLFFQSALGDHVELRLVCHEPLPAARVDPGLLQNALLNLAINSRDAMNQGGVLTLSTHLMMLPPGDAESRQLPSGHYVSISVRDTGCGIDPDVIDRVFEPFFTTKEKGKGTGLGLAMVYGFVRQSGGQVDIESRRGTGTTVRLLLPAVPAS